MQDNKAEWLNAALDQAMADHQQRRKKLKDQPAKYRVTQELYLGALHAMNVALIHFQAEYELYGQEDPNQYGAVLAGLAEELTITSLQLMKGVDPEARKRTLFKQQQRMITRAIRQGLLPITLNAAEKLEQKAAALFDANGRPIRRDN